MHLRAKTTRRLLILGVIVAVFFGIGATLWAMNNRRSEQRIAQARADAMAAFAKGDFATALPHFNTYLTDSKTAEKGPGEADAEALLAYGKSRQAISMPRRRHLSEAIKVFERYLQIKPGDRDAQHLLLELYPSIKYNEEALSLAAAVLKDDPKDIPALRARSLAFANQRKFKDALAAAEQRVSLAPDDLEAHAYIQTLMLNLEMPAEEIVGRYEKLLSAHPDDPRFELLLARAHHLANNPDKAAQWLKTAAGRNSTDPEVAAVLTNLLEKYKLFHESNVVLERLAESDDDAVHTRPLVKRLWQSGRARDVLKRTDDQDPQSPMSDTDLLAYRALAMYDLNRPADAAPIIAALAARTDDMAAIAWATALRARENENLVPRERARQYQESLERTPDNEVIYFFLGEAYVSLGESEPALHAWREAARLAPSWAAPSAAVARTLAATGRSAEALQAAAEAYSRSPKAVSTVTGYAVAWFADQQQNPDPAQQKKLLDVVEKIQAQIPREPETLHIHAALLSRTGQRDKAIEVIKSALTAETAPPRDTLLALASVSYSEKLGLERAILDFAEQTHGLTPPVAIRKAALLAQGGKPQEGLKLIEAARQKDTTTDAAQWSLALLQYRESIGSDGVLADWVRLGDAQPDNALIQSAVLRSPMRFNDKAFWNRTIDRLKKLSGDEALTPRIERARWLLTGETSEKAASEAIVLLRAVDRIALPEIHRLLGIAHEKNAAHKTGAQRDELLRTASTELEKAFNARNSDAGVATDLTRVYRAMGRNADADRVMSRVADRAADLGVDGRKRTARTLVSQGQLQKAIEVLEPVGDGNDAARDALLCGLYRRTGANDKAAALYGKLLTDARVEPGMIVDGADFFTALGKKDEAEKFLAKLRSMDMPPASRALLLAKFAERHGTPEEALKGYEAAVAADAAYPAAWQGLIGFHLRRLQFPEAVAAADRAIQAVPDDRNLQSLRARAVALQGYKNDPSLETLADELSNDPQSGAITDMLRILADAKQAHEPLNKTVPKLRELADRNPDLLRLQMYVAQGHARLGQFDEAEKVAMRASLAAPNDADAARLLAVIYAARPGADKWPKVLEAGRQWRQRSLDNPMPADVLIAQTLLEMRRPAEAVSQLQPYLADAPAADTSPAVVGVYVQALLRTGDEKEAAAVLLPLAKTAPAWRKVWLQIATAGHEKADDATRWIEQVAPLLSSEVPEQVALAEAWVAVGSRFASPPAFEKAKAVIEPLTTKADAGHEGWRLLAALGEATGDTEQAIRGYRKLLEGAPQNSDLQNNLAFALLQRSQGQDLSEARQLAETAVAQQPASSTYLDTLARIHLKAGDLPAAEVAFQRALAAQHDSLDAMIGLADVHAQAGRQDKARELLVRINNAAQGNAGLTPALQQQLDSIRQLLKAPVQSGRAE